jgi:membrane protease YdiL (CAAX protease family)
MAPIIDTAEHARPHLPTDDAPESTLAGRTYVVFSALIGAWILAWMLKVDIVDHRAVWFTTSAGSFTYWTVAKVFIWILPALRLIRMSGRTPGEVFNVSNWRSWLAWGGGIGLLIAVTGFLDSYLDSQPLLPTEFSIPLFSVLAVAPTFEEFLIHGAVLGNLQRTSRFWTANVASSLLFVILHLPGWYFMGSLADNLTKPLGGAFSIFLLGLAFGFATYRSRSVIAGMLGHFLNNLA